MFAPQFCGPCHHCLERPLIPRRLSLLQQHNVPRFNVSMCLLPVTPWWRVLRYSFLQQPQNSLASACTCLHWPFMRSFPLKLPSGAGRPDFCIKSIAGDTRLERKDLKRLESMALHLLLPTPLPSTYYVNVMLVECDRSTEACISKFCV